MATAVGPTGMCRMGAVEHVKVLSMVFHSTHWLGQAEARRAEVGDGARSCVEGDTSSSFDSALAQALAPGRRLENGDNSR